MSDEVKPSKMAEIKKNATKFFKDIKSELKKVIWPTRSQLINNTLTVLMACLVVGVIIWVADKGLTELDKIVFDLK